MKQGDVVTFGEAMVMFVASEAGQLKDAEQFKRSLAGAELNTAIGFARLGLHSGWVSKVGNDAFGAYIRERLQSEKVDITGVLTDPNYPTGFQLKSRVMSGDPEVQYFRKGSAASTMAEKELDHNYFTSFRHLHMTGIPPALTPQTREFASEAMSCMKKAGRSVSFDPNLRPTLWSSKAEMVSVINDFAVKADWVLPGVEEGKTLTGFSDPKRIAEYYLDRGVSCVVVKLGAEGAYYRTADEEGMVPGFKVRKVIDTVGAGDGFAVGLISGLLQGLHIKPAVLRGNAIGALAVQNVGDHEGYPTEVELEHYIQHHLMGVI